MNLAEPAMLEAAASVFLLLVAWRIVKYLFLLALVIIGGAIWFISVIVGDIRERRQARR